VDEKLYRGGQPAFGGIRRLKEVGVRTIVNLRSEPALVKAEEAEARAAGLQYFSVPMHNLRAPTDEQIARVLGIIDDPHNAPVFVHCLRGSDRTGTIVACYRISHSQWTPKKAIQEAYDHGMTWLEYAKRSFIRDFYAKLRNGLNGVSAVAASAASPASQLGTALPRPIEAAGSSGVGPVIAPGAALHEQQ